MKYKILSKPQLRYLLKNKHLINEEIAKQMIVSRGFYDRAFFVDYFLGHFKQDKKTKEPIASAPFQLDMLQKMATEKNLNIIYPRDHAKTTNSLFDTIHDICYEIEPATLLIASEGLGVEFLGKLRDEFATNELIIEYFGELVPSNAKTDENKKRTSKRLQFNNGCEIETVSKGGTVRGKRPTKLKCQPKGNEVITSRGIVDVSELSNGDSIMTHTGEYKEVYDYQPTAEQSIYGMTIKGYPKQFTFCEGHQVYCRGFNGTHEHRFAKLWQPSFIPVEEIKPYYMVGFPIDSSIEQYNRTLERFTRSITDRCSKGKILSYEKGIESYTKTIDKDDYYILGLFCGDGTLLNNGIKIFFDKKHQEKIEEFKQKCKYHILWRDEESMMSAIISNVELMQMCQKIKIKSKNSHKLMPIGFERESLENQREWLRGYINSDGRVSSESKKPCVRITSVCLKLLEQAQRVLLRFGIVSSIRDGIEGGIKVINGKTCNTQKKYDLYFRDGADKLGYDIKQTSRNFANKSVYIEGGYLRSTCSSIEKLDSDDVCYSFKVRDNKSYCNHLVANHNCDDPQENKDVKNPQLAKEFIQWFFSSIYNTLDPTGRCIVIGTIMSELCFVNILAEEDRGFTTIKYPAVLNPVYETIPKGHVMQNADGETIEGRGRKHLIGGTPIWGVKWSLKALDDRMQIIGRDAFQQEYMHEPMSSVGDLVIHPDIRAGLKPLPYTEDPLYPELRIFRPNENTQIDNEGNTVVLPIGQAKQQFSIGVDTSSGTAKGDFSTIVVRDNLKKLYATYRGRLSPDQLCKIIQRLRDLGYYPKDGALGIEVNNTGLVTITEARNAFDGEGYVWYPYIYQQEVFDKTTEKRTTSIGWNTNNKTRPIMVETYKKDIIIDQVLEEFDEREIVEMKTFVYNDKGKAEAPSPYHDDLILADMLSLQMVEVNTYTFGGYTR